MKSNRLEFKSLLIIFTLLFNVSWLSAQEAISHEFLGNVFIDNKKAKDVIIKVFEGNKCFSKYQTRSNGKFIFTGGAEKYYTLQFEKEGYITKRVSIRTYGTKTLDRETKTYKFDISLDKQDEFVEGVDYDFPVAIIEYKYLENQFDDIKEYTENRLKNIALKENRQIKTRENNQIANR